MIFLFWLSAFIILYTYAGYPLIMRFWSRSRPNKIQPAAIEPTVSVVIAAYNEEDRILPRVENLLASDYPKDKLDIVIVSDGSTDSTVEKLQALNNPHVHVIALPINAGKALAVNEGVEKATGEIVVFADVRQRFSENAIRSLVETFADESVGGATGELILMSSGNDQEPEGVGLYWKYEKAIREMESTIDSTVGATGAIYAIRRALYEPLPDGIILDDVLTPIRITKQGYRVVMVREAHAFDTLSGSGDEEFARKVRTLAGNYQLMSAAPWINSPSQNRLFFQWISHKVSRLITPFFMILMLIASFLICHPFYTFVGILQVIAYSIAGYGCYKMMKGEKVKGILNAAASFLMLNFTAIVALYSVVSGNTAGLWKKH